MVKTLSREILESIMSTASDAVIVTDEQRKIVFFNKQAEEIFGVEAKEVIGKDLNTLLPKRFAEAHVKQMQDFVSGDATHQLMSERSELVGIRASGEEFPVEITISKVPTAAGIFATAIVRDVTQRKLEEQQLKRNTHQLQTTNENLKKLDAIKNQFLGMATHDLRNPLIRIRNGAEMLLSGRITEEQRVKLLKIILSSSETMLLLISDLLDVNRIESGHLELNKSQVELKGYFEELIDVHQLTAQKKDIALELKFEGSVTTATFDPKRMHQVVENLLSNAIKFSGAGTTIKVIVRSLPNQLEFLVIDQGVGIPEAEIPKLFGAFQQLSPHATAGEKGTGLGLVIAKKIIEFHGGRITVQSKEGAGSEFKVIIPR